jgi:hypothetical protein
MIFEGPQAIGLSNAAAPSRRSALAAGLSVALAPALVRAADIGASPSKMSGWREAVLVVPDLAPWIETLTVVGGWECAWRGPVDTTLNAFWSLPPDARTEQALMRNIGTRTGFLRLVKVIGAPQRIIRPDDQAWESGGIQALDMRVVDMEATRAALHARGWRAPSEPIRYKTYGVEVIEWTPSSPDGIRLAFIQRLAPPLQGWAELKRWARASNAAITVKDMAAAKATFGGLLGMTSTSASHVVGDGGPNVMGMPWSFAAHTPIDIVGFTGVSREDSSIELIAMPQALGRDYAADAHPPNLGIAALRFRVADAVATYRRLAEGGAKVAAPVQSLSAGPDGEGRGFGLSVTDGVRLEFVEGGV